MKCPICKLLCNTNNSDEYYCDNCNYTLMLPEFIELWEVQEYSIQRKKDAYIQIRKNNQLIFSSVDLRGFDRSNPRKFLDRVLFMSVFS